MAKTLPRLKKINLTNVIEGKEETKTIIVKKAPLGQWKGIVDSIKVLSNLMPEVLKEQGVENPEEVIAQLQPADLLPFVPQLLEKATDEVLNLIAIGAGVDVEVIENEVGIDEAIDILEAIIEVNALDKSVEKVKNLMKRFK